jgi:hypothetical protein
VGGGGGWSSRESLLGRELGPSDSFLELLKETFSPLRDPLSIG